MPFSEGCQKKRGNFGQPHSDSSKENILNVYIREIWLTYIPHY